MTLNLIQGRTTNKKYRPFFFWVEEKYPRYATAVLSVKFLFFFVFFRPTGTYRSGYIGRSVEERGSRFSRRRRVIHCWTYATDAVAVARARFPPLLFRWTTRLATSAALQSLGLWSFLRLSIFILIIISRVAASTISRTNKIIGRVINRRIVRVTFELTLRGFGVFGLFFSTTNESSLSLSKRESGSSPSSKTWDTLIIFF